ncbi:hypothetical protein [Chromobacterium piscinae]|uniref:hypothetical protein n=1 Tax=Chromobacterium amazonense TaxID=1382803 RepID=UPI000B0EA07C
MQQFRLSSGRPLDDDQAPHLLTLCPDCVTRAADHGILEIHGQSEQACALCGEQEAAAA